MKCFLHIWRPRASTLLLNSRLLAHLSEFLLTDICNLGDAQRGATLFKARCQQCHSIGKFEGNKGGPNLYGVVGRKTGEAVNYKYSEATKQKNITWSEDTLVCVLFHYLEDPARCIPGTRMVFDGVKSVKDRHDLITYVFPQ
ncbi:hypothetical protein D6C77_09650 [Aureobasidium pullulans]|nr:hypothetical protein D6C77_09650 [Aureobasidium pullulans]